MTRLTVYIIMASIVVVNVAVFGFIFSSQSHALPTGVQTVNEDSTKRAAKQIHGSMDNRLERPMDVAITNEFMYVTDTTLKKVHVFNLDGDQLFTFGEGGSDPGQFDFPYGISVDIDGKIYVADMYNSQISIFDKNGDFIDYFAYEYSENGTFISPAGLRIINETVYVTDVDANKVFVFDLQGQLLLEVGEEGMEEGQLLAPNAVTADEVGNIFVVDTVNDRIQMFDDEGNFIRVIDGSKNENDQSVLLNPRGIGINSKGSIYVVSNMTNYIYVFNKDGEQLDRFGGIGQGLGQLHLPNGLFIDSRDNIYVTDNLNLRISVFQ